MKMEYWFEMGNKWTFKQPKLLKFILKYIPHNSKVLIPFAGKYRFGTIDNTKYIYNDINPEIKANHNIEAYKLAWLYPKHFFDCIISDPPFTHNQTFINYSFHKNKNINPRKTIKRWRNVANYLLKTEGIYIELGYNSTGLIKKTAEKYNSSVFMYIEYPHKSFWSNTHAQNHQIP